MAQIDMQYKLHKALPVMSGMAKMLTVLVVCRFVVHFALRAQSEFIMGDGVC